MPIYSVLKFLCALLFFNVCKSGGGLISAETKSSQSTLQAVNTGLTLYKDAILVRKTIPLGLSVGTCDYHIRGIASTIYPQSLKVSLQSSLKTSCIDEYKLIPDPSSGNSTEILEKILDVKISAKDADPDNQLELLYFFKNLGWQVYYTLQFTSAYDSVILSCWVEVINQSAIDFKDARVQFADGNIPIFDDDTLVHECQGSSSKPIVYKFSNPITLNRSSSKRINWAHSLLVPIKKQYRVYIREKCLEDLDNKPVKLPIEVWINFSNTQKQGLGLALPAGIATLYCQDLKEEMEVLGSINFPYTAVNQDISLKLPLCIMDKRMTKESEGFEKSSLVEVDLIQTEYKKLSHKLSEANYKMSLANKGNQDIILQVILDLPAGLCRIVKENKSHNLNSQKQISWDVNLPAQSDVDLKYRLQMEKF